LRSLALLASLLLVVGCEKAGVRRPHDAPSTTAVLPKLGAERRCPLGHTTVKLVPIVYGMIAMTPERRAQVDRYEVAFGGCDVGSMGEHKIVCTTCGTHTYAGSFPWYDKTTKVIPTGQGVK
jgi:hypothetical protein